MNAETKLSEADRRQILEAYAAGDMGTRDAIEALGYRDFADILIGLAQAGLELPKPADTPARAERMKRAREILLPIFRQGA
jgi:hypothetical protein